MKNKFKIFMISGIFCFPGYSADKLEQDNKPSETTPKLPIVGYYATLQDKINFFQEQQSKGSDTKKRQELKKFQSEQIEEAKKHSQSKIWELNFYASQLKEAAFKFEGQDRKYAQIILSFLERKMQSVACRFNQFRDSQNVSEGTKSMSNIGIGKYSQAKTMSDRLTYAHENYECYRGFHLNTLSYKIISFSNSEFITHLFKSSVNLDNFLGVGWTLKAILDKKELNLLNWLEKQTSKWFKRLKDNMLAFNKDDHGHILPELAQEEPSEKPKA